MQRVEAELHEEDPPVDGVEADLQRIEDVLDGWDSASRKYWDQEGGGEGQDNKRLGEEDSTEFVAVARKHSQTHEMSQRPNCRR